MENKKTIEEVKKIFVGDRFATENGAVMDELGNHTATVTVTGYYVG